jgi:hypothetical protein
LAFRAPLHQYEHTVLTRTVMGCDIALNNAVWVVI